MPTDEQVFQKDGFRCVYCGFDGRSFEGWRFLVVDHFRPRSKGGADDLDNLVTACMSCNSMKSDNEWPSLAEARKALDTWGEQMRSEWKSKVKPLVPRDIEVMESPRRKIRPEDE